MTENKLSIANPIKTNAIIKKFKLRAKKQLGQNFLTSETAIDQICDAAELTDTDTVIEIGPGIGALTEKLAQRAKMVYAFEIDESLLPVLADTLMDYQNVEIINQDILKVDLKEFINEKQITGAVKVVANLPYYITTPILLQLLDEEIVFDNLVLMMQKEVAERVTATPGHREYGSLSIGVQSRMDAKISIIIGKKAFFPQPKIDSAVVSLTKMTTNKYQIENFKEFNKFVRSCFAQKRKSLWNNLLNMLGRTDAVKERVRGVLAQLDIPENTRAEQLPIEKFKEMFDLLGK
ncbi:16S rRNA (adenine(1518)-N(6)/adenine(1519)-N(6))-dimethyltransferase RsmA [Lactobacillus sp. YT155]|uniref:16S rRNA (adenine(1518)-N(6)/adenine(1519)-N(6))- dimethyltransferase RsmA n=1 Tax=Lactobacillus sp. YT155 TaxID=3060955 RepID=UPI00265EF32B|nr:16S rRNA (adenine(1518)-N(6)/adenine(1519)-N(6))-dimethyltransferase RsmA [Lactobacillus sp. YT155]MDO1604623.1 16S rRNA (adenine(1518)-N(6)/adenine(1519)-N(6))-dimethyltransferase RsmA [Lactobacillus sp. YT155]